MTTIVRHTGNVRSQNHAFMTFKVFFNWAVRRQYIDRNPLTALKPVHRSPAAPSLELRHTTCGLAGLDESRWQHCPSFIAFLPDG